MKMQAPIFQDLEEGNVGEKCIRAHGNDLIRMQSAAEGTHNNTTV